MRAKKYLLSVMLLILISGFVSADYITGRIVEEFESDSIFLKIGIVEGGSSARNIKVSNNLKKNHFSIIAENLEGIVSFDEREFELSSGQSRDVKVYFNAGDNSPGIYIGKIKIISDKKSNEIPVVLEIQSKEVLFDSNIRLFPYGQDIILGETLDVEIRVFDLVNRGFSDVAADYFIKDFDGNTIIAESENLIVDSNLDYSKSFKISEKMDYGSYVVGVALKYGTSVGTSSIYFEVEEDKPEYPIDNNLLYFLIFTGFFLIIIVSFGFYLLNKNNLVNELRRGYGRELKLQRQLYDEKLKAQRGLKGRERKIYRREVRKIKKQRESAIKKSYSIKLKEIKRMKKKGGKINYNSLIKKWKKTGYDTKAIEKRYKYPSAESIRKKVREWKKEGYDTKILER